MTKYIIAIALILCNIIKPMDRHTHKIADPLTTIIHQSGYNSISHKQTLELIGKIIIDAHDTTRITNRKFQLYKHLKHCTTRIFTRFQPAKL